MLPYSIGIVCALLLWNHIALPFENPWHVVSPLAAIHYNPANNVLRFAVLLAAPVILLTVAVAARGLSPLTQNLPHTSPDSRAARTGSERGWWLAIIVAIAMSVGFNQSARPFELDMFHEGESLGAAVSWESGRAPYSGIVFAHGVYEDPLRSVIAFRLLGRSIGATRTVESLQKLAGFALLALLVARLFGADAGGCAAMAVLALACAMGWTTIQGRNIPAFVFLLSIVSILDSNRSLAWFLWPLSLAVAFADSVDRALVMLVAFLVILPLAVMRARAGRMRVWPWLFAGTAVGAMALAFAIKGQVGAFVQVVFLKVPRYWDLMDGIVFPILDPPFLIASLLLALDVYWLASRLVPAVMRRADDGMAELLDEYRLELAVGVVAVCFFRAALGRADTAHLAVNTWPIILLSMLVARRELSGRVLSARVRRGGIAALASVGVLVCCVELILAAANDSTRRNFPLRVPDSRLVPANYVSTIQFLRTRLGAGETFFAFNNEAIWYYFVNKPAPGRFYVPWFAVPEPDQRELTADLEANRVRYVLYSNNSAAGTIDGMTNAERLPLVDDYLRRNYHFMTRIDDNEIWERNASL